eukprot:2501704-Alexandrium_andersonii.AAC.1
MSRPRLRPPTSATGRSPGSCPCRSTAGDSHSPARHNFTCLTQSRHPCSLVARCKQLARTDG